MHGNGECRVKTIPKFRREKLKDWREFTDGRAIGVREEKK
jgi:hypothetical protein